MSSSQHECGPDEFTAEDFKYMLKELDEHVEHVRLQKNEAIGALNKKAEEYVRSGHLGILFEKAKLERELIKATKALRDAEELLRSFKHQIRGIKQPSKVFMD